MLCPELMQMFLILSMIPSLHRKRARADQCLKHAWLIPCQEPEAQKDQTFEPSESQVETPETTENIMLLASYAVHCPCRETIETDLKSTRNQFTALKEIHPEVVC